MPRQRPRSRPPSQTCGTFVRNHLPGTLAIDFLTVPTATFGVLYVFFVLSLERGASCTSTSPRIPMPRGRRSG